MGFERNYQIRIPSKQANNINNSMDSVNLIQYYLLWWLAFGSVAKWLQLFFFTCPSEKARSTGGGKKKRHGVDSIKNLEERITPILFILVR